MKRMVSQAPKITTIEVSTPLQRIMLVSWPTTSGGGAPSSSSGPASASRGIRPTARAMTENRPEERARFGMMNSDRQQVLAAERVGDRPIPVPGDSIAIAVGSDPLDPAAGDREPDRVGDVGPG